MSIGVSIRLTLLIGLVVSQAHAVEDDSVAKLTGRQGLIDLSEYWLSKKTHPVLEHRGFDFWETAIQALTDKDLVEAKDDNSLSFLARRIAETEFASRTHPLKSYGSRDPMPSDEAIIARYSVPEYRLVFEHAVLFSPAVFQRTFKVIANIRAIESLPLLESCYDWKPRRLEESKSKFPVRRYIAETFGAYHTQEALESLNRLWTTIATTDEDKDELVSVVATDDKWKPVLDALTEEQRTAMAKYLEQVKLYKPKPKEAAKPKDDAKK